MMTQRIKVFIQSLAGSLTRKINGPHVYALLTKTENGLFAFDPEDFAVGRRLRLEGRYGIDEIERLKPHITPTGRVLVVGAHIGTLAIPISRECREVVAVEANPITYELLTRNIALNGAVGCRALNIAASNREERISFLQSRVNSGGSKRVPRNKRYIYYSDRPKEITLPAFSLDQYLDNHEFDVVVMDIEGSEYFALQGMQDILAKTRLLAVEFLPHHLKDVSGVTAAEFVALIAPHFSTLTIPSKQKTVDAPEFVACLSEMYDRDEGDQAILFEKRQAAAGM